MRYHRISADCHIDLPWLPADLFTSNASAALKDRMPYVATGRTARGGPRRRAPRSVSSPASGPPAPRSSPARTTGST